MDALGCKGKTENFWGSTNFQRQITKMFNEYEYGSIKVPHPNWSVVSEEKVQKGILKHGSNLH